MNDAARLSRIIHDFTAANVLIVGDIILDRYSSGVASRLSPEAPVPVLRQVRRSVRLGGAANVAANVAALGGRSWLMGIIGDDDAGRELATLLGSLASATPCLFIDPSRPTTTKTRFIAGAQQLLRLDEESTAWLDRDIETRVADKFEEIVVHADIVILSDYAKGLLSDSLIHFLVESCAKRNIRVIVDPKRRDFSVYRGASIVTPNETELGLATGHALDRESDIELAGRMALEAIAGEAVVVTRSERGLALVPRSGATRYLSAEAREVADVSGAGDTLVTALAMGLAVGSTLEDAARIANVAAGLSVGKQGTAVIDQDELLRALHVNEILTLDQKIVSVEDAVRRAAGWREAGLRVGFTNGCFDLVHPGHVRLLQEARAACDRLVVALNSDDSVKRLKGPSRPIQTETARATVIASLASADLVTLFPELTPLELIRKIRPDVLIKGSDYQLDRVVGGDLVQGWGGQVLLVDLQAGHSTTETIRRMTELSSVQPSPVAAAALDSATRHRSEDGSTAGQ